MIDLAALPMLVMLPAAFAGGLALGYIYFRAVRETADLTVNGGHPVRVPVLILGRLALLCAGFYLAVLASGLALLAALAGVLGAKSLMLRRARSIET